MKRFFAFAALVSLSMALGAHAQTQAATPQALEDFFGNALHCRSDFPDARDKSLAEHLRQQGVVVLDRTPGETLNLLYVFPMSLSIDGTEVNAITVQGDSGTIVAARVQGDLQAFVHKVHAKTHPRNLWAQDGFNQMLAQFSRTQPLRHGLDAAPPRLIAGRNPGDTKEEFRWGCRSYDN